MALKSGQPITETTLGAGADNTVVSCANNQTKEVYSLIVHDTGTGATVDLFLSDDGVSANGKRIEQIILAANETKEFKPVTVGKSKHLVIRSDVAAVNYHGSYTDRSGSDA